jgi:ClpP class serine protease
MFVSNVAKMRGMTSDAVTATEAGLYFGENAITAGLADHIGTLSDALNDLGARISGAASRFILNPQPKEFNMKDNHPATETQGAGLPAPDKADPAKPDSGKPAASTPDLSAIRAEAAATAQKQAFAYVTEVTELCQLAGHPEKAAAFIASTVPIEGVRQALLAARAAEANASAIAGHVPVNNGVTAEPKIDTAAIYANRNQKKG